MTVDLLPSDADFNVTFEEFVDLFRVVKLRCGILAYEWRGVPFGNTIDPDLASFVEFILLVSKLLEKV